MNQRLRASIPITKFFNEIDGKYDPRFYHRHYAELERKNILVTLLDQFLKFCSSVSCEAILMHGALIGWHWNRRMLPWDQDIDVCIFLDDLLKLNDHRGDIFSQKNGRGFLEINPHFISRDIINLHAQDSSDLNKIDARFIDPMSGIFLDITALHSLETGKLGTKCPHVYNATDLMPLRSTTFENVPVNVPNRVETVLKQEYGATVTTLPLFNGHYFDHRLHIWARFVPPV